MTMENIGRREERMMSARIVRGRAGDVGNDTTVMKVLAQTRVTLLSSYLRGLTIRAVRDQRIRWLTSWKAC